MYRSILIACLAAKAISQSTVSVAPVSQIADGQPQAPAGTPIAETPFVLSTTTPYSNPFTSYSSMTNSLGVVTGMPSVVTSQPALGTSQPISPTSPTYSGHSYGNMTTTPGSTLSTRMVGSANVAGGQSASRTGSATLGISTGGAESDRIAGAGLALVILGLGFSLL